MFFADGCGGIIDMFRVLMLSCVILDGQDIENVNKATALVWP